MLEVMMVLTVLNTAVAVAALVMAVTRRGQRPDEGIGPYRGEGEPGTEEKPFKLSDKKMQEGIANLLGYEVGKGGEGEDR